MVELNFLGNVYLGKNNWWRYFSTVGIIVIGSLILGNILIYSLIPYAQFFNHLNPFLFSNIIIFLAASFILSILFISVNIIHKRNFLTLITSHKSIQWKNIVKCSVVWLSILSLTVITCFMLSHMTYSLTFSSSPWWVILIFLISISLSAFTEEVIVHGYLLQAFSLIRGNPIIPLLITSFIFSALHYHNVMSLNTFVVFSCFLFSLVLGWVVLAEGGLETAIGVHISNNIFTTLICNGPTTLSGKTNAILTLHANMSLSYIDFILITIFQLGLLIAYVIYYNRKRQKLFY